MTSTQIVPQTQLMQPNKFCFFDAANFPSLPFFFFLKNLSKLSLFLLLIIIFPASESFLMSLLHKNKQKRFWAFWFQSQGEGHHISLKSRGKALLAATNAPFRWSNWPMKWMEPVSEQQNTFKQWGNYIKKSICTAVFTHVPSEMAEIFSSFKPHTHLISSPGQGHFPLLTLYTCLHPPDYTHLLLIPSNQAQYLDYIQCRQPCT